ncbi:polysaccharide biosynthesis tyrosine autokinase [Paraburkholderia sp. C35]|uniref:polysaccharide biosynthesis tyrosine autokinase n=1 Tax=Paraburkholderia sp. C35 TaxID=2126993 RepID=UPI000D699DCC|nr:polysaccharide biosynthesis tyrosine autokinase [Paraburkholderia sp. C35]
MGIDVKKSGFEDSGARRDDEDEVVLGYLLNVIVEDVWCLIGVVLAIVALGVAYCFIAKPVYVANALIKIEQDDDPTPALMQLSSVASAMAPLPADAEIAIMQSRDVMGPVVKKFKFDIEINPKRVPILGNLISKLATPGHPAGAWFGLSSFAWGGEVLDVRAMTVPLMLEGQKLALIDRANGQYDLQDNDGNLLVHGFVGTPASRGDVSIFVDQLIARPGTRFTVIRINDVDAVNGFQKFVTIQEQGKLTGLVDVSMESDDPSFAAEVTNDIAQTYLRRHVQSKQVNAQNMLSFLKTEEPRLKSELDKAEVALAQYQRQSGSIAAGEEAKVYLAGSVEYEQQMSAMRLQLAALQQRFGDDHPQIKATREQIAQLAAQRDRYEGRFRNLPESEVRAVQLQRDAKVAAEIYELVLTREQELSVQKAGTGGNAQIIDAALRPGTPVKPKKLLIMSASTMLGLIFGVVVVIARSKLSKGIDDPEAIERMFQLPVCGIVPLSEQITRSGGQTLAGMYRNQTILAHSNPTDPCVESLRSLRTSIQFKMLEGRNRIVMLTGPVPGVGKSFLTVNLAVLLANSGKKVLMIDADMRRGTLDRYLDGIAEGGLAELLAGTVSLEKTIRNTSFEGLDFISCGQRPSNPAELLTSSRFASCLHELEMRYDVILIDTPPVLAVTDASLVGEHAGSSFLVMRSGMHRPVEIADTLKRLKVAGIDVKGGIFNGIPPNKRHGYGVVYRYLTVENERV